MVYVVLRFTLRFSVFVVISQVFIEESTQGKVLERVVNKGNSQFTGTQTLALEHSLSVWAANILGWPILCRRGLHTAGYLEASRPLPPRCQDDLSSCDNRSRLQTSPNVTPG